ncbi:MAG: hypothetical protein DSY77_01915 [Bacteroidetes bacterium]|nr:MAG: hypothetical protein DSY77_01915 [Bacteroidota bacterium]
MGIKNILIISYHALPFDVVASYRTKGYCDYLIEYGIFPTLVTHRWEKGSDKNWAFHNENEKIIYEKSNNCNIIRLPRPVERFESNSPINTIKHWVKGDFDLHLLNSYKLFKIFLFDHLKNKKYDAVLAIFSPHYHLKLAFEINKQFKIPYVLDFRDLWDNQIITKSYNPPLKKKIQDLIIKFYWRKWLNKSIFFSTTSSKWISYLEKLSSVKGIKIRNGHEISSLPKKNYKTNIFRIAYFGRIYPYQNLEIIIKGINKFINRNYPIDEFELCLIGIKNVGQFNGAQIFKKFINEKYIVEHDYMSKEELIKFSIKNVNLFILPNLKEDNGSFFVKLFDYISLNKPLILAPKNGSENDIIVKKTNAGLLTSSSTKIALYLERQYRSYREAGMVNVAIDKLQFKDLHRTKQVEILAKEIKKY